MLKELLNRLTSNNRKLIKYISNNNEIDLINNETNLSWKKLKKHINPNVKKLRILLTPEVAEDLSYLKNFSSLEEIDFGNNLVINEEILNQLKNTNVKKVIVGEVLYNKIDNAFSISNKYKSYYFYNGLEIITKMQNKKIEEDTLEINVNKLDKTTNKIILEKYNEYKYRKVKITSSNEYIIDIIDNKIKSLTINGDNLNEIYTLYNYLITNHHNIEDVIINSEFGSDVTFIKKLAYIFSGKETNHVLVTLSDYKLKIEINKNEISIYNFWINKMDEINEIYNYLTKCDYHLKEYKINLTLADKYNENYDYEALRRISKQTSLTITYESDMECNFEEFKSLVEAVKWYRSLIVGNNLSPVEKYMYAFDIVKSFEYKEENDEDLYSSRLPHRLMTSGNIVCVGYAFLLKEIILGLDKNIGISESYCNRLKHMNNLVRIDDDKYNIHGVFLSDATWSSLNKEFESYMKNNKQEYSSLDLYHIFLLNVDTYMKINDYDESYVPELLELLRKKDRDAKEESKLDKIIFNLFNCYDKSKLEEYLLTKNIKHDQITEMIRDVRIAEGYAPQMIDKEIKRVMNTNIAVIEYEREVDTSDITENRKSKIIDSQKLDNIKKYLSTNTEIKIDFFNEDEITNDIWKQIKNFINPNITTLEVPLLLIQEDLSFLMNFPNLNTLVLTEYNLLSKQQLEILSNTNIKNIEATVLTFMYEKLISSTNMTLFSNPFSILQYKNITIRDKAKKLESISNDYINITTNVINKNILERLYSSINTKDIKNIYIKTIEDQFKIIINNDEKIIERITITSENLEYANSFYNYFKSHEYQVNEVIINLSDRKYDKDYNVLKELSTKTNLKFSYSDSVSDATYDEFMPLLESVKWYRSLINENNLSPTEKVMYAYDILKTFKYKKSEKSYDSRDPHKIMLTGNIVCVGYASLFDEIINGLDDNISSILVGVDAYEKEDGNYYSHARNLIRIDDDKYNIHGIFVLDPTWDSVKTNTSVLKEGYNALDLYRYFLIPYEDYEKTFGLDTMPKLYTYKKEDNLDLTNNDISSNCRRLFKKTIDQNTLNNYLNTKRPTLDVVNHMLYNVRISEGYSKENIQKELQKIKEVNDGLIAIMRQNGSTIEYFEESTKIL